jgi:curli biogenesis system outer membrane secretion channel CsgG
LAGCTAAVDKQSVRATQTAPESTQVEVVRIPYDASLPYYVVTVEPLAFDAASGGGGSAPPVPGRRYGWGPFGWGLLPEGPQARAYNPPPQGASPQMGGAIASQLVTALSNVGNVRIIDWDYYLQNKSKPGSLVKKSEREVGPFVIRGNVTEFNEIAEATGSSTGGSLGGLGAALGVAGAIAGNTPAAVTGASVAIANPTFENTKARRTGSVAMDLTIVNPANGRLVGSVVANGSFTSESAANGFSLFGFGKASNAFAASALGQANRAAMNSATTQISDRLRSVR